MTTHRAPSGGLIDRAKPLNFRFDGKTYQGFAGDTLASALIANGVSLVGRSFKYHRPRGILSSGADEPNALVTLRTGARAEPNCKATTVELYEGLEATSQNHWPSLRHDAMAVTSLLSPFFVAGFYYKTFKWPGVLWENLYEPLIRRAAGLGHASKAEDPDAYEKSHAFCDLIVIGAGPAGLMAALTAARAGARVLIADDDTRLGGRLLCERFTINDASAATFAANLETELAALPNVRILARTTVFGAYDDGTYGALERVADHLPIPPPHTPRQRYWKITAKHALLASGATEKPITFAGNDKPAIMYAGAMRAYANRYAALAGRTVALFTSSDDGWRTAHDLTAAGAHVTTLIDARAETPNLKAPSSTRVLKAAAVREAFGGARIAAIDTGSERIACDALAISGGWSPNIALTAHHGGRPRWRDDIAAFVAGEAPRGMTIIGAAAGDFALSDCLRTGAEAGARAAADLGFTPIAHTLPRTSEDATAAAPFWRVPGGKAKAFVDFQHDVTDKDIALADREGYRSIEHVKRYTTLGMATDQGRASGLAGAAVLAELRNTPIPDVGVTKHRPPYGGVAIGALAGRHRGKDFRPTRLTPSHAWAEAQNAIFTEAGAWLRAQYFPKPGERDWLETVTREVRAVRSGVGVCDVSTLGKIDIQGPDAIALLERVYVNTWRTLPTGRVRYGLMLREDGFVMDDGTTARLAEDHFVMTTTTANAAKVFEHLEYARQVLWPEMDVQIASVTDQWAQYAIAGPNARALLQRLVDAQHDISNDAFPYLAAGPVNICGGQPARLFRVSFSGELGYELAVPTRLGDALMRALMREGQSLGVTPYGTEALSVLRIEKGHPAGNELSGQTTAADLGLARMIAKRTTSIGQRLAERPALTDANRPALVGLKPIDKRSRISGGAHIVAARDQRSAEHDLGYVTSAAFSPHLDQWIALALVANGCARHGQTLWAIDPIRKRRPLAVTICDPVFFDPEGARLRG